MDNNKSREKILNDVKDIVTEIKKSTLNKIKDNDEWPCLFLDELEKKVILMF